MSTYIAKRERIQTKLRQLRDDVQFDVLAMDLFQFQYEYNKVYHQFCQLLGRNPQNVVNKDQIPFLPIQFFKSHVIKTGDWNTTTIFGSSGTTGAQRSQHHVRDSSFYLQNTIDGFSKFYAPPNEYCFMAVLPGYQERKDSSLIYMIDHFIKLSKYEASGFYLNKKLLLKEKLLQNKKNVIPTILFGVSFALLDLTSLEVDFPELIVIETGGMKNAQIEMTKEEIIQRLKSSWNLEHIHSEYGMTELLSQAYSSDGKWYETAATMEVVIGQLRDPLALEKVGKTGVIKIIDLANYDTCSFIETQDLGLMNVHQKFQVLGRMDNAELRGCNLLLDDPLKDPIS